MRPQLPALRRQARRDDIEVRLVAALDVQHLGHVNVVEPAEAFREWVAAQFESICGKKFPVQTFDEVMGTDL